MNGEIVRAWKDGEKARLVVRIRDGLDAEGLPRFLEVAGSTALLNREGVPKDAATLRADALADVRRALAAEPNRRPPSEELPWAGEVEL